MDELLRGKIKEAPWCMLFADDMVIVGETVEEVEDILEKIREALENKGLKINRDKAEHLKCKWKGDRGTRNRVKIQGK